MQEMSDRAAPGAAEAARADSPTAAEQAAASPLLRALVARYLTPDDPSAAAPAAVLSPAARSPAAPAPGLPPES